MILRDGTRFVACWGFSTDPPVPSANDDWRTRWHSAIELLLSAGLRLHAQQLMEAPLEAKLRIGGADGHLNPIVLQAESVADVARLALQLVAAQQFAPGSLEVRGLSVVANAAHEERALPGVVGLDCSVYEFGSGMSVWTLADIWMPYNLMAQPQPVVAALNAPRLRAALEAIEQIVGKPGYAEDSRFAKVDGYELRNHIVRGDVLDLQDMGYDESRIVERWPEPAGSAARAGRCT
jgi:hypothetical protein